MLWRHAILAWVRPLATLLATRLARLQGGPAAAAAALGGGGGGTGRPLHAALVSGLGLRSAPPVRQQGLGIGGGMAPKKDKAGSAGPKSANIASFFKPQPKPSAPAAPPAAAGKQAEAAGSPNENAAAQGGGAAAPAAVAPPAAAAAPKRKPEEASTGSQPSVGWAAVAFWKHALRRCCQGSDLLPPSPPNPSRLPPRRRRVATAREASSLSACARWATARAGRRRLRRRI